MARAALEITTDLRCNMNVNYAVAKLNNSVSEEHLQWIQLVCQYALEIPSLKVEATTDLMSLYVLVKESVTDSEALSLVVKILSRLGLACSELQACETPSCYKMNSRKLDFVLTLLDVVRDLPKDCYDIFLFLARRQYLNEYHESRINSRSRLIRLLLDQDFISTTNFGMLYVFLERAHNCRQHTKLDQYCEEQGLDKPDWRAMCVQAGWLFEHAQRCLLLSCCCKLNNWLLQ